MNVWPFGLEAGISWRDYTLAICRASGDYSLYVDLLLGELAYLELAAHDDDFLEDTIVLSCMLMVFKSLSVLYLSLIIYASLSFKYLFSFSMFHSLA